MANSGCMYSCISVQVDHQRSLHLEDKEAELRASLREKEVEIQVRSEGGGAGGSGCRIWERGLKAGPSY